MKLTRRVFIIVRLLCNKTKTQKYLENITHIKSSFSTGNHFIFNHIFLRKMLFKTRHTAKTFMRRPKLQKLQARFMKIFHSSGHTVRFECLLQMENVSPALRQLPGKSTVAKTTAHSAHIQAMCSPSGKYTTLLGLVHIQNEQNMADWPLLWDWAFGEVMPCRDVPSTERPVTPIFLY